MRGRSPAIIAFVLAGAALWLFFDGEEEESHPPKTKPETTQPASKVQPATDREADREQPAPPATPPQEPAGRTSTEPARKLPEPSLIDQLIAIRAIESQSEVSAYLVKNAELAKKYIDQFCEESNRLRRPPRERAERRDAAAYLAPRVDWNTKPPRHGTLHVPEHLAQKISGAGKDWPASFTESDLAGLDFDWMRELHNFDYWSLLGAGPITEPNPPLVEDALPYYVMFLHWTKLRLATALRYGGFAEASRDLRHLGDLIRSQGILLSEMIGIVMLQLERDAFDAALARGLGTAGWIAPERAELDRLRLLSRHSNAFFFPGVDPQVMKQAASCAPAPCAAIVEGAWMQANVGEFSPENTPDSLPPLFELAGCDRRLLQHFPKTPMSPEKAREDLLSAAALEKVFGDAPAR